MVIKEDRGWGPEEAEPPEQRLVLSVVRRHVGSQQLHAGQLVGDARIAEGKAIHLLAGHAPVGIEVEQYRLALRIRERRIELIDALDAAPGHRSLLRRAGGRSPPFPPPQ